MNALLLDIAVRLVPRLLDRIGKRRLRKRILKAWDIVAEIATMGMSNEYSRAHAISEINSQLFAHDFVPGEEPDSEYGLLVELGVQALKGGLELDVVTPGFDQRRLELCIFANAMVAQGWVSPEEAAESARYYHADLFPDDEADDE